MPKDAFPNQVCGCPSNRGSLKGAIIGGIFVILCPMILHLILTYSFSIEGLKAIPDAVYDQFGKVFMYSEYDPVVLTFTLIISGLIMGAVSGGVVKSIFSVLLFYVVTIVCFFLLGLMYLGENTQWEQFTHIASYEFLIAFGSLIGSAIVMALIVNTRSNNETLPYKMKVMKRNKNQHIQQPHVQYVQYVPVQGVKNQLQPNDIDIDEYFTT